MLNTTRKHTPRKLRHLRKLLPSLAAAGLLLLGTAPDLSAQKSESKSSSSRASSKASRAPAARSRAGSATRAVRSTPKPAKPSARSGGSHRGGSQPSVRPSSRRTPSAHRSPSRLKPSTSVKHRQGKPTRRVDALRQHHEGPSYGSLKPSTRKPGHGGSHGGRHDRGHGSYGGYGGHYGGHYGGYFGGYYGGYRGPYRYGYGYGPYRRPFSGYFGSYGFSWYPYFYLGYGYGGYGYSGYGGYGYGSYPRYRVEVYPRGALDLNIRPKDTGVYVDGYYVGTTGAHDGWPRHLWLEEGTHELIFYKDGYRTVVRNVLVRPDGMVRLQFRMEPGESIPPAELTRAGERERERASPARRAERREPRPYAGPYRDDAPPPRAASEPSTAPSATSPPGEPLDLRREAGRVHLAVSPAEASVYLDGRFIGLAGELGGLEEGLLVDPGEHRLEIFHPGHNVEERTLSVSAGEKVDLEIDLDG